MTRDTLSRPVNAEPMCCIVDHSGGSKVLGHRIDTCDRIGTYLHVLQPVRFFGFHALWRGLPLGIVIVRVQPSGLFA